MSAKEVKFGVDARDRMLRGVEILNNAVKVTLGSIGRARAPLAVTALAVLRERPAAGGCAFGPIGAGASWCSKPLLLIVPAAMISAMEGPEHVRKVLNRKVSKLHAAHVVFVTAQFRQQNFPRSSPCARDR
jgi:hypothetical protein